jgi:TRAP-type transport system periplasmic protein
MTSENSGKASQIGITRRTAMKSALALGAGLAVTGFNIRRASAAPIMLRFGSDSPINAPHTVSAVTLKKIIEDHTSGRVQITIFPDGQLGSNEAMSNAIKAGTLDGVVTDCAVLSTAVPEADVMNLPFLFRDTQHALQAANGSIGAKLKPKFEQAFGCEVLGYTTDGARNMWNSRRPIQTPDDVRGLKMRIQPSQIQQDTYTAFGAQPTPIAFSEVYTALQTGVVDGADHAPVDMVDLKMYQVTKYLTLTRHFSIIGVMVMAQKALSKLTPADQDVVRAAAKTASEAHVKAVLDSELAAIETLKTKGIKIFSMKDPKAFVAKVQPVYQTNAARIGTDLIDEARQFA